MPSDARSIKNRLLHAVLSSALAIVISSSASAATPTSVGWVTDILPNIPAPTAEAACQNSWTQWQIISGWAAVYGFGWSGWNPPHYFGDATSGGCVAYYWYPQGMPPGPPVTGDTVAFYNAHSIVTCPAGSTLRGGYCYSANSQFVPANNALPPCGSCQGNPINAGNGNKYQREVDYLGGGSFPLRFERVYNSNATAIGTFGQNWRGFYDRSIKTYNSGTLARVIRADGVEYYFNLVNGAWVPDAEVVGVLTSQVASTGTLTGWTYVNENDETETYDATGKLITITNRAGQKQTLTYSCKSLSATCPVVTPPWIARAAGSLITVTDPAGRSINFAYDGSQRIVTMTDPHGYVFNYAYSGSAPFGNLVRVTGPDGKARTYLYGEPANVSPTPNPGVSYASSLTGMVDENGVRFASWTYDAAGRATSSEHGAFGSGIEKITMAYTAPDANGNSTTSVTDSLGTTRTYNFNTVLGMVKNTGITGQPCAGCSSAFTYDANGNVASTTDFNGNKTCVVYDLARNLDTVRIEGVPSGTACPPSLPVATLTGAERQISTTWNTRFRLPASIAEPLRIMTYTYDANGNVLTRTIQPTSDANGSQGFSAAASGTARTWTYTYNAAGQVLTEDGPRTDVADVTTYAYDAQGNLVTVTDALNHATTFGAYDANGRPGSITDPNGLVTTFTYDSRGRVLTRNTGGETTTYAYDGTGNLTSVGFPAGASYTYSYDQAHRLIQIADALNNKVIYTLDKAGNRTAEKVYDSANTLVQTHSRVFNALSQLVQDIGAVNQATTYTYDNAGNVLTATDPLNRQIASVYDALNRLVQVTTPDTGVTHYAYDGLGQVTSVTDPRSLVTQYARDGLTNLTQQKSPDTGMASNTYDAAGNVLMRTDAKGQVASYAYDAKNRVTSITYAGSPNLTVSYAYDTGANGIGHLTGVTDATGTVAYAYDQHGRVISETAKHYGGTYTTGYTYDTLGRLASVTYPSGRVVNYTFDTVGRVAGISTTSAHGKTYVLASSVAYRPMGGVRGITFGDGQTAPVQTYTRQFDQDGRVAGYTLNNKNMSVGYDAASQISFIADQGNVANTANYTYDSMSRLTSFMQGTASQTFTYDKDGNRVSQAIGSTLTGFGYGAASNWLTAVQTKGAAQTVSHDANGATKSDGAAQYAYDARGRLIQTTTAQGIVNYEINALGMRVRKQVPYANSDTEFHYDVRGHLIAEGPPGQARFSREYIWLGDVPVTVMQ